MFGWTQARQAARLEPGRFKLHIGIDAQTLQVRAICVTSNNVSDAAVMPELLAQVPVQKPLLTVTDDGGYETQPVHATVMQRNSTPLRTVMRPSPHADASGAGYGKAGVAITGAASWKPR